MLSDGTTIFGESTNSSVLNLNVYAVDAMGNTLWKSANVMTSPWRSALVFFSPTRQR